MSVTRRLTAVLVAAVALVTVAPVAADAAPPPRISVVSAPSEVAAGDTLVVRWRVQAAAGIGEYGDVDGLRPGTWAKLGGIYGWIQWCGFPLRTRFESGSDVEAIFSISCRIPEVVPNSSYTVFLSGFDRDNVYAAEEQITFQVVGGSSDVSVPRISEVSVDSTAVPGRDVIISWRATDASGVAAVTPWAFGPNGRLTDDAGAPWLGFASGTLVSGTDRDGRYSVSLPLSASAAAGTYTVWFSVLDVVGNREATLGPSGPGSVYAIFTLTGRGDVAGGASSGDVVTATTLPRPGDASASGDDPGGAGGAVTTTTLPGASASGGGDESLVASLVSSSRVQGASGVIGLAVLALVLAFIIRGAFTRRARGDA